jgi:uncharacterized protein involved in outer membrane biogenesis
MALRRKWLRVAIALLALLVVAQIAASVLVRTPWVHAYLIAHLERAFGRQVEVNRFDAQVFPSLRLDANGVSVSEDPAFGNEYFLRAEKLAAGLRWTSLLQGHFDFGALTLSHPSLILVRNGQGRWNLEDWLPPAKNSNAGSSRIYGPPIAASAVNRLQKIEFEDGRVNFKTGQDKQPFAFITVSGSVEQTSSGRWQLQLEAQPWRSGVALQSTGTLQVRGDIAGTSARLQPAHFAVHWTDASLADLLRLFRGQDYGVRGSFTLDAAAQSGNLIDDPNAMRTAASEHPEKESPSDWTFTLQAHAASIHRWDLTERADNPRLTLTVAGRGNIAARTLDATEISVASPRSNLRGTLHFAAATPDLQVDSAGIQVADLLAWWRAFEPGVDEGLTVEQYLTGSSRIRGWPPKIDQLSFSSYGGAIKIPGVVEPVWIGAVRGGRERERLTMEPVRIQLGGERSAILSATKRRVNTPLHDAGDLNATQDFSTREGGLALEGQVDQIATVLRAAAAIGRPINLGWELKGRALGELQWDWNQPRGQRWSGKIVVSKALLAVAGLNRQLQIENAACVWDHGKGSVLLGRVDGFGTSWSGAIQENRRAGAQEDDTQANWNFSLHGNHLDAAEIDRWVGPRARPGWLQSLLQSLSSSPRDTARDAATDNTNSVPNAPASELLRRLDADGNVTLDELTIEKLSFENVQVVARLQGLQLQVRNVDADWCGGTVHAILNAKFSPHPSYDLTAELDGASLAQIAVTTNTSDHLSGLASGTVHFTTDGVGRENLLQNLVGRGRVSLKNVEFRGWDVAASVVDGSAHPGISHWSSGAGTFALLSRKLLLDTVRLDGGKQLIFVNGTVDFAREADLLIRTAESSSGPSIRTPLFGRTLKVSGPLDAPLVTVDVTSSHSTASIPASAPQP